MTSSEYILVILKDLRVILHKCFREEDQLLLVFPGYSYNTTHQIPPCGRDDKQTGLQDYTLLTAERHGTRSKAALKASAKSL